MKKLGLLLLLVSLSHCGRPIQTAEKPNIIFVLADDLGYGDLSTFNENGKIQTPHLDRMAQQGMKFTDAHTSSAVCTPTRYGILTGRYNWRSPLKQGVLTGKSKALIPNHRSTIASVLKNAGYTTAFFGKWHLGWNWALKDSTNFGGEGWDYEDFTTIDFSKPITNTPNDLGFDYAYGHSGSLDMAPYVYVENGRVTQLPDTVTEDRGKYTWWRKGPTAKDFIHEKVTPNFFERAFRFIKEKNKNKTTPFFLYLALPSPHTPILPTSEWLGKSGLNPYGDFVQMIDAYMGQLENVLKAAGIEDNTLVIFTSDNGASPQADFKLLAEKGHHPSGIFRGHKADIYEGGHRVPFIAKWPAKIKAGQLTHTTICTTDLFATYAEIAKHSLLDNEGEDSFSLLPLFFQSTENQYLRGATVHHSINGNFALRKGDWKLILSPGSGGWSFPNAQTAKTVLDTLPPLQLFHLATDPEEKINRFAAQPAVVKELKALLIDYIQKGRSTPGIPQQNDSIPFVWKQIDFIGEE